MNKRDLAEKIFDDYNKNQFIKSKPYKILSIKVNISLILGVLLTILSLVSAFIIIDWYILIPLGLGVMLLLYGMHLIIPLIESTLETEATLTNRIGLVKKSAV